MCTSCMSGWELFQAKVIYLIHLSLSPQLQAKESTHHRVPKYVLNSIDIVNRMLGQRMNLYIGCFSFSSKRDDRNAIDHLKKTKFPWSL